MDYKEKLRLAKEALESDSYDKETIEYIFPELKESEDEKLRKCTISLLKIARDKGFYDIPKAVNNCITWLEKKGEQKPAEWSEEDKRIKNNLLSELTNLSVRNLIEKETEKKYASWLKSLRPQSAWKPSDEEMEALRIAFEVGTANESWAMSKLKVLYEQLNKL